jgi:hypothetical protein
MKIRKVTARTLTAIVLTGAVVGFNVGRAQAAVAQPAAAAAQLGDIKALFPHDPCPYGYLCLWEHSNQDGFGIGFYYCGVRDLSLINYPFADSPAQGTWRDRVSSYVNNQTPGRKARFYNMEGGVAKERDSSVAYEDVVYVSDANNDIFDRVAPC